MLAFSISDVVRLFPSLRALKIPIIMFKCTRTSLSVCVCVRHVSAFFLLETSLVCCVTTFKYHIRFHFRKSIATTGFFAIWSAFYIFSGCFLVDAQFLNRISVLYIFKPNFAHIQADCACRIENTLIHGEYHESTRLIYIHIQKYIHIHTFTNEKG